jgi:hypothetical protein
MAMFLTATQTPTGPPLVNTMITKRRRKKMNKCWNCEECIHFMQETMDDVACCNCCEDGDFFEEYGDEYTFDDLEDDWW